MKKCILLAFTLVGILAYGQQNTATTDRGVVINGIKWATRNVDNPGAFAANPESPGKFYQWNRKAAWPATGRVSNWDNSVPAGTEWEEANDPSPAGWRVPTADEFEKLLDSDKVRYEWTVVNGVNGGKFTDKATGNSIFLPAAGGRSDEDGMLFGDDGYYWSSTEYGDVDDIFAYYLTFDIDRSDWTNGTNRSSGFSLRPVAE